MISRILIIASGGLLAFSKSFVGESGIDDDLVSGFLTAISNFAMEIKGGQIEALNFKNFKFIYDYDKETDVMFILIVDLDDIEEEARKHVSLMKEEFLKRYHDNLINWSGEISLFNDFEEFVDNHVFIPPKVLLVGEDGVGKTTILDLFPGETVLQLDEDLNEIIQKSINVAGLGSLKQILLREIDLEDLIDNSKVYRPLLNSVDIICMVTNSGASNLGRTKKLYPILRKKVKRADIYIIANFQDLKDTAFDPKKIEEAFGVKTYGFSAVKPNEEEARKSIYSIVADILKISVLDKIKEQENQVSNE